MMMDGQASAYNNTTNNGNTTHRYRSYDMNANRASMNGTSSCIIHYYNTAASTEKHAIERSSATHNTTHTQVPCHTNVT